MPPASGSTASRPTPSTTTTSPKAPAVQGPDSLLRNGVGVKDNTYQACASTQGGAGGPLVWTTAGYGLLVDSDNGYFRITDEQAEFRYGHPQDRVDNGRHYHRNNSVQYYLIAGTPKEILASVAEITGRAPMFPRWAMGFTNSQWGSDQWEFYRIMDNYRARDIPIDNFTLTTTGSRGAKTITANSAGTATSFPTLISRVPTARARC